MNASGAITNLMDHLRLRQEQKRTAAKVAAALDCTVVAYRSHPLLPFIEVTIYGPTEQAVQTEINRVMRSLERDGGGKASFHNPRRIPQGGYGTVGEVVCG